MADVELPDVQAATDVFNQLYREADDYDVEKSIRFLMVCRQAKVQLDAALAELESRALRQLEQPIIVDGKAYSKKLSVKQRAEHDKIIARVMRIAAQKNIDGELHPAAQAAENAAKLMADLYVSPSSLPKKGGLAALGLNLEEVSHSDEAGGKYELKVVDLG